MNYLNETDIGAVRIQHVDGRTAILVYQSQTTEQLYKALQALTTGR